MEVNGIEKMLIPTALIRNANGNQAAAMKPRMTSSTAPARGSSDGRSRKAALREWETHLSHPKIQDMIGI